MTQSPQTPDLTITHKAALIGSVLLASEMDDNLGNGTHRHIGVPDCIGPICVCDTLVIEMIAKPALPIWFSDTV